MKALTNIDARSSATQARIAAVVAALRADPERLGLLDDGTLEANELRALAPLQALVDQVITACTHDDLGEFGPLLVALARVLPASGEGFVIVAALNSYCPPDWPHGRARQLVKQLVPTGILYVARTGHSSVMWIKVCKFALVDQISMAPGR